MTNTTAPPCSELDQSLTEYGGIPVRNLWLLMFYASALFKQCGERKVAAEDTLHNIPDLVAELLCRAVEQRIRRNLSFGYQAQYKTLYRVRGHIDFLQTRRHQLEQQGKVACRYDEFTVNTPRNCFIRAALDRLAPLVTDTKQTHRCQTLSFTLQRSGVTGPCPPLAEVSAIRFGRHDVDDQRMIAAARLVFELAMPTQQSGKLHLPMLSEDIHWIRKIYEKGIAGFYDVVLPLDGWNVCAGIKLNWQIETATECINEILPSMKTDIVLEHPKAQRRIVIDTKFNQILQSGWYKDKTLRSGYLYQIYAYLRSQERGDDPLSYKTEGILLHPTVKEHVDEQVVIQGHSIRFVTVDLTVEPQKIREKLINLVSCKPLPS